MEDCTCNPAFDQDCISNACEIANTIPLYLSDLSERDKLWDEHRAEAEAVEALYVQANLPNYGGKVHDCSRWLGFLLQPEDTGELKLKLAEARFCRVRQCPVCQWRRAMKWRARFLTAAPRVTEAYPTHRWLFLTLTVANCPVEELRATLQLMGKSWERLTKRKTWSGVGWIRSTEVTRSKNGYAHPHYHCLILVRSSYFTHGYINQSEWTQIWKECLRVEYTPVVHVTAVKSKNGKGEAALQKAILETMKYGVKVQDLTADANWLAELTHQVRNTRAISIGGVLRDFIKDEEPVDLIHDEDEDPEVKEKEAELWFSWQSLRRKYVKANV